MPALITHHLFGEESIDRLPQGVITSDEERIAFILGNQGPDPFFFHMLTPRISDCMSLAQVMHRSRMSRQFSCLRDGVSHLQPRDANLGRAFALGLLSHYVLDRNAHPFVYEQQFGIVESDSELEDDSTIRNFRIVQTEGSRQVTRNIKHYNLQMIIAVGFKVNSERAVQFRKWVNQIAKDYTIKGWGMDDERLKRGTYLTEKYFDEQLERIREIRASERKFYQKITDLYATAIDYDKEVCG